MKRKTIIIICVIVVVVLLLGLSGGGGSNDPPVEEKPVESDYGFDGFAGVYKSKDGSAGLWVDDWGYGILLNGDSLSEGHLVPVSGDDLSFKVGGALVTFNAKKDLVAFGGFGGTVLYRDTTF